MRSDTMPIQHIRTMSSPSELPGQHFLGSGQKSTTQASHHHRHHHHPHPHQQQPQHQPHNHLQLPKYQVASPASSPSLQTSPQPRTHKQFEAAGVADHKVECVTSEISGAAVQSPSSKKGQDCNFAEFSHDKLTVHQDLLVARNPRRDEVKAGGVTKSNSFRRRKVSIKTIKAIDGLYLGAHKYRRSFCCFFGCNAEVL